MPVRYTTPPVPVLGPYTLQVYDAARNHTLPAWPWVTRSDPVQDVLDVRLRRPVWQVAQDRGLPVNTPACTVNGAWNGCSLDAGGEVLLAVLESNGRDLAKPTTLRWTLRRPGGQRGLEVSYLLPAAGSGRGQWVAYAFFGLHPEEVWEAGEYVLELRISAPGEADALATATFQVNSSEGGTVTPAPGPQPAPTPAPAPPAAGPVQDAVNGILTAARGLLDGALAAVQGAVGTAADAAEAALRQAQDAVDAALREAERLGGEAADALVRSVDAAVDAAVAAVNTLLTSADSAVREVGESIAPALDAVNDAVTTATDAATNAADQALRDAQAAVDQALRALVDAGEDVSRFAGEVGEALGNVASGVAEGLKDFLTGGFKSELDRLATLGMPAMKATFPGYEARLKGAGIAQNPAWLAPLLGGFAAGSLLSPVLAPLNRHLEHEMNGLAPTAIPGAADLVTMELREVFRPEEFAKATQPPPSGAFVDWMRKQGFAPDWAMRYWAAHWRLPSVEQGYEMYHRLRPGAVPPGQEFTEADLRTLLKVQDLRPDYHERLVAVSRPPITRVDLRRMFRLGVLDEDGLLSGYMDLGYSEENARALVEFTKKDVEPAERELSVALLTEAFQEGLLDRATVATRLAELGYGPEDAGLLLTLLELRMAERNRKESAARARRLAALKKRVAKDMEDGQVRREDYDAELADLELSPLELREFWEGVAAPTRLRALSASQVLRLYREGQAERGAAEVSLKALGYDAKDTKALLDAEDARKGDKARDLTVAQVLRLYRDGVLDREPTHLRLMALGHTRENAELLLTGEDVRLLAKAERA